MSSQTYHLDARRLLCPMPVIRTQDMISGLTEGDQVVVVCTDPGVLSDIPSWCRMHGHEVLSTTTRDREITITVLVRSTVR